MELVMESLAPVILTVGSSVAASWTEEHIPSRKFTSSTAATETCWFPSSSGVLWYRAYPGKYKTAAARPASLTPSAKMIFEMSWPVPM